jgi:enoyl-CoA hydratase/carnithine racemase
MSSNEYSTVHSEKLRTHSGACIGVARLDVPKSLHSLSLEMIDLLTTQFEDWVNDPEIVLVLLEASGDRAFCAGADLHNLHRTIVAHHASAQRDDIRANPYALDFFSREYRLDYRIHTYPKPVLCWGHGIVMGGGVGLMSGASHRVVTETSRVAMPEISIGLFPDVGGTWILNRLPGRSGLFLALTAAQLNADDALFARLADYKISQGSKAQVMARLLNASWGTTRDANSRLLTGILEEFSESSGPHGPLRTHLDLINEMCRHHDLTDVVSAIKTHKTDSEWLAKAAATLTAGSPGSAALSAALLERLLHCSLADTFRHELVAALTCATRPDLAEGIRALLIDKDRKPRWSPASLDEISTEWLDGFFSYPWSAHEHPLRDLGLSGQYDQ